MCPHTTVYVSSYEALKQAVDKYDSELSAAAIPPVDTHTHTHTHTHTQTNTHTSELSAAAIPPLTGPGATHLAQVFLCYICVLILLYMCPHTTIPPRIGPGATHL
jgi:hypothetical protein